MSSLPSSSKVRRRVALFALAIAGLASTSFAAAVDSQTPFVKVVLQNFVAWDVNHDGKLSTAEIDDLLKDPAITGDSAAAVAALKLISRAKGKDLPPLTTAYFQQYNDKVLHIVDHETAGDALEATTDAQDTSAGKPIDSAANWDKYFVAGKSRLAKAGGTQWTGSVFDLNQMKQGSLGDCFFVSSLASVLSHRPQRIQELVKQLPDGSYEASFLGLAPFKMPKLTQSQIAISGTSGEGAFLAVFEQSFGKYKSQLKGGPADVDGTDLLYRGGDSAPTLQALTGHATKRIGFAKYVEKRAEQKDEVLPRLRAAIVSNMAEHRAITCGLVATAARSRKEAMTAEPGDGPTTATAGTLPILPADILKNHVYVVTDYDPKTDLVEIWNPHAQNFTPKGEPGLVNGYVTKGGKFKVPLAEAYQFYGSFTFETDQPAKLPTKKSDDPTT